jgi:hypothetical protein
LIKVTSLAILSSVLSWSVSKSSINYSKSAALVCSAVWLVDNSASRVFYNSVMSPYTLATRAGSALVPIWIKALMIGLYIANLEGKCFSKADSILAIPLFNWTMFNYYPWMKAPWFNLANSTLASLVAPMASSNSEVFLS